MYEEILEGQQMVQWQNVYLQCLGWPGFSRQHLQKYKVVLSNVSHIHTLRFYETGKPFRTKAQDYALLHLLNCERQGEAPSQYEIKYLIKASKDIHNENEQQLSKRLEIDSSYIPTCVCMCTLEVGDENQRWRERERKYIK